MKNILAGHDGCHGYCCDDSGDCIELGSQPAKLGVDTNEECQSQLLNTGFSCAEGEYLSALYY